MKARKDILIKLTAMILPAISLLCGCSTFSVNYSFTGASLSPDDKTVHISFFPNRATLVNPSLSQYFTDALKDRFVSQTNLALTDGEGDLKFSGEIVDYNTQPTAVTSDEQANYNRLTIKIRVKYESLNNPEFNFDQVFSRFEDYESTELLSAVENDLTEIIVKQLIDDIFNKSVVNW